MYYLTDFCCICLCNNKILQQLSTTDNDNITYLSKIISSVPEMSVMNDKRLLCKKCCDNINITYKFRQQCLRSKTMLVDYISQLRSVSNVSGKLSIRLTDFQLQQNEVCVKSEDKNEGIIDSFSLVNVIKTEPIEINNSDCFQMDYKNTFLFNYENSEEKSHSDNIPSIDSQIVADNVHIKSENINEIASDNPNLLNKIKTEPNEVNNIVFDSPPIEKLFIKTEINTEDCIIENTNVSFDGELKNKNKTKKKPPSKLRHECTVCKKTLARSSALNLHMRTHTGERPYKCTLCDKTFVHTKDLKVHMRTHTGELPFECTICGNKFSNSSYLIKHMRTHTGERPYECAICKKSFAESYVCKEHMKTHTGERPFECTVCGNKFTKSYSLNNHLKIHTGERPYECKICSKKFIQSISLKQHMRNHTGK